MRKSSLLLAALAVAFATASFALWRELEAERARGDALASQLHDLSTARAPPPRERDGDADFAARAPIGAAEVEARDPAPAPSSDAEPENLRPDRPPRERGVRTPEFRAALRAYNRLEIEQRYRDLGAVLKLSPQQADAVFDLLAEQSSAETQFPRRNRPGSDEEREQMQANLEALRKKQDGELRELLGQTKFEELKQYQETLGTRVQINRLRSDLAGSADPLREDQIEPLIAAVAAEQQKLSEQAAEFRNTLDWSESSQQQSRERYEQRYQELQRASQSRIRSEAGSILSQRQLSMFTAEMERRQAMSDARARMREARGAGRN